ncbi:hypothetical protein [Devosia faecipullorum]|uniref:hypothetical protein n=1 Tax=Devosia faecipullorum TaxID=2755039 RepID=UPI00187B7C78|nr:hypothetical protein [Devosia faecipullorum]MBE7733262.1 hypothetical protein [Devosia faecipullorum]
MADRSLLDIDDMLDLGSSSALLDAVIRPIQHTDPADGNNVRIVVDFTFRLPPAVLDEIREMARNQGCTVNAMMAGLVDLGLQARGRPGIAARHPEYVAYLQRGRRGAL